MKIILILCAMVVQSNFLVAQEKKIEPLGLGMLAPDFDLPGVDGRNYTLQDFDGYKMLAVIFTCNHCPTAQAYERRIIDIVAEYRPKGVGFVAISPNSPPAISLAELGYSDLSDDLRSMKIRAKEMQYNFPYLYDGESQKVSIAYGPAATPQVFIFDHNRKLAYRGRIDDTENPYISVNQTDMRNALDALLKNQAPSVATTKTFGCSIKWAWKDEWTKKLLQDWAQDPVSLDELDLEGARKLLKNETENYLLVNLWATWCGPCVIEFPEFVTMDRMYRGRNFEFVSISADKSSQKDKALSFLQKKEASNRNYIFDGEIYDLIEVVDKDWQGAIPYTVLIAPGGKVVYKVDGTIEPLALRKEIVGKLGRYYADNP